MWLVVCLFVFLLAFCAVPPVIALSWSIGAVDVPCDWRRMHHKKIPRGGGLAIFFAFFVGYLMLGRLDRSSSALLFGGSILLLVGLLDDVFCLNAWVKLAFQVLASILTLLLSGGVPSHLLFPSLLWVVMLCNAHNMIDGLDGLLSGCAAIEGLALALFFFLGGHGADGIGGLLLAVSCLGFRVWNRYPAQVFAGDCGSTVVGFIFGILSLPAFAEGGFVGGLAPFLIFAYPLTDLVTAVLRRILRGKSPFAADRGHLHHRISAVGLTQVQSGGVLLAISASLGCVGVFLGNEGYLIPASLASLAAVVLLLELRSYILDFA